MRSEERRDYIAVILIVGGFLGFVIGILRQFFRITDAEVIGGIVLGLIIALFVYKWVNQ